MLTVIASSARTNRLSLPLVDWRIHSRGGHCIEKLKAAPGFLSGRKLGDIEAFAGVCTFYPAFTCTGLPSKPM
jgi:hypothetical protein